MPVQDWTRVDPAIFHDFHLGWAATLQAIMNNGLLPDGYYALVEQHHGRGMGDLLTMYGRRSTNGLAVADAPPRAKHVRTIESSALVRRRSLAVRHVSGHRLVALLEIVSLANKDRARHVEDFAAKAVDALDMGVHLLLVDLFPPGPHDPFGMHGAVVQRLEQSDEPYDLPADEPLTLAGYAAGPRVDIYLEHLAVGAALPEMPLFLRPDRYVNVPLEATYQAAYRGMPAFWRDVLEGRTPATA